MTNERLREKYRTQKAPDDRANHDLSKYLSDAHARVRALSTELGLKFQYGTPGLR
uniref:Uncharacterized protein n=1 Tax=Candidatus Kentrum eta TaxID=2126337 RepID=A0A450V671_9GAMM|nr:MAG: hypothetical protein BECKH772A_GA0070896_100921 [Candidatus Kentron sp. H]VFK00187.1 MAG: hypothetical protein BECKH772B_GA0070898_101821 [Candidatus Kentron sp. H]VFK04442.1 MAG: hypothetical protein BECKH772C_GA0070978_101821 [Candidatus Kentron sp. H]